MEEWKPVKASQVKKMYIKLLGKAKYNIKSKDSPAWGSTAAVINKLRADPTEYILAQFERAGLFPLPTTLYSHRAVDRWRAFKKENGIEGLRKQYRDMYNSQLQYLKNRIEAGLDPVRLLLNDDGSFSTLFKVVHARALGVPKEKLSQWWSKARLEYSTNDMAKELYKAEAIKEIMDDK